MDLLILVFAGVSGFLFWDLVFGFVGFDLDVVLGFSQIVGCLIWNRPCLCTFEFWSCWIDWFRFGFGVSCIFVLLVADLILWLFG